MEYILETKNLTKKYFKNTVVDNVTLKIKQGEIYGFIGRNGAGKTTTLKIIGGLADANEGEVLLYGKDTKKNPSIRKRLGLLIETPDYYPYFSAFETIEAKCRVLGIKDKNYVKEILEIVGLSDTGNKKVKNFSLGMKQRLGIGLALVGNPDILLLDEPINGLDPQGIAEMRDIIHKLNKEKNITILISSHILEELSKIATCYGIIHKGKLIKELTHEELMKQCSECITVNAPDQSKLVTALDELGLADYKAIDSSTVEIYTDTEKSGEINKALVEKGVMVMEISVRKESVEDFFFKLTQ